MSTRKEITYFEEIKQENTEELMEIIEQYQKENNITDIVISTNTGESALKLIEKINPEKYNIIAISLHAGFDKNDNIYWNQEYKQQLEEKGVTCFIGSHALSGIDRGITRKFGGFNPAELIAQTYKTVSEGTKVAVEVSIMAADAGLVPTNKAILAIGGHRGYGVDTAILLKTAHMNNIFDLKIHEILATTKK